MSILGSALKKLPKDLRGQIRVVFVTTDPDRDSPQVLHKWLNAFSKDFVGLTGTKAEIRAAQTAAKLPLAQGAPNYDHAAFVVAYTKDNLAHLIYPSGIDEHDWLHDLPELTKETWSGR
jgi:protein SCO1/2